MGSTTSIHNDTDKHVVSFVGVHLAAAIGGSIAGIAAAGGVVIGGWLLGAGAAAGAGAGAAAGAGAIVAEVAGALGATTEVIELVLGEATDELLEAADTDLFHGGERLDGVNFNGMLSSQVTATVGFGGVSATVSSVPATTFSGLSETDRRIYTARLVRAGYALDENKRTPGMRKLLETVDVATQKSAAEKYAAQIGGELLAPGETKAYRAALSLVRTSWQYTFSGKEAVVTFQQGQRTVWTGATHNSDFTYKVSENNLEKWDGK